MSESRWIALTRAVSPTLECCELTHLAREPIDAARAAVQHQAYERALVALGVNVVRVAAAPELPDAVFVEDTAVVLDEIAVLARPGAPSRRAESEAVAVALAAYRPVRPIGAPATLDGGDVLRLGRTLHVGRSSRTNDSGIDALRNLAAPFGYRVASVEFSGCLHLKSAATALSDELVLLNPAWVSPAAFTGCDHLTVDEKEPYAANALRVGDAILYPAAFPRTAERMIARGLRITTVDCDELAKAEGAVTCCSLLFEAHAPD